MVSTLSEIDQNTKSFSASIAALVHHVQHGILPPSIAATRNEIVSYVLSDKWSSGEHARAMPFDESTDHEYVSRIQQDLYFDSIADREAAIPQNHAQTFEWIFRQPPQSTEGQPLWSDFSQWLESDSREIYWITGKPRSGKSTLVKFASNDPRFTSRLKTWAGDSQLVAVSFFSWNAGMSGLQKTHSGLLRTCLFEALQQRQSLVSKLFPARLFLLRSFGSDFNLPVPNLGELTRAFRSLLGFTGGSLRLALVVDGLDEFEDDHESLVQLLADANKHEAVKICVSSRPWNLFRDKYGANPMLRLEDLTRGDIKLFIENKLDSTPGYRDFLETSQKEADELISDILDKAHGVFLWVSIIFGLLEQSFRDGARVQELRDIIQGLPGEVSELFRYIWKRTSPRFRADASKYFQIAHLCEQFGITPWGLMFWFGDPDIPAGLDRKQVTDQYLGGAIKFIERRLISRTGGLLELYGHHSKDPRYLRVEFMHRTAADWAVQNWDDILSATGDDFDPLFWAVKGQILRRATALDSEPRRDELLIQVSLLGAAAQDMARRGVGNIETLVYLFDRFDSYMTNVSLEGAAWVEKLLDIIACSTCGHGSFLDLAAQLAWAPYIKEKFQQDQKLFRETCSSQPILERAVLSGHRGEEKSDRLGVVDFLLTNHLGPENLGEVLRRAKAELETLCDEEKREREKQTYHWASKQGAHRQRQRALDFFRAAIPLLETHQLVWDKEAEVLPPSSAQLPGLVKRMHRRVRSIFRSA